MNKDRILILSPHTDDAELGCGGTISKLLQQNKEIFWVVFSTAEDSLPAELPKTALADEFVNITRFLGLKENNYKVFNFKVRKLDDSRQEVLEILVKIRKEFKPDLVIGPSLHDFHQDHAVVANEMIRAFKTNSSIISYELPWNNIQFDTQFFVRLTEANIKSKIAIIDFYKSQQYIKRHYFTKDFIKGLASARGAQIGEKFAEAFEVIRWIY